MGEGDEKRRRKKKRRRKGRDQVQKGIETNIDHGIEWIYGTLRLCMVNILSPKLGFDKIVSKPWILENRVGKTPYGTR